MGMGVWGVGCDGGHQGGVLGGHQGGVLGVSKHQTRCKYQQQKISYTNGCSIAESTQIVNVLIYI